MAPCGPTHDPRPSVLYTSTSHEMSYFKLFEILKNDGWEYGRGGILGPRRVQENSFLTVFHGPRYM